MRNTLNPTPARCGLTAFVLIMFDMGVDGYRLDTANFYFHDALLRDNPGKGAPSRDNPDPAVNPFNPYAWQAHVYDKSRPENLPFLEALRALLDQYPDIPMPWQAAAPQAGFSSAVKTWLPLDARHINLAVDQQTGPDSLLGYFKQIIAWRKTQPALLHGDMQLWDANAQTLVFERKHAGQSVLCAFNFSDRAAELNLPADWAGAQALNDSGTSGVHVEAQRLRFEPWGCAFLSLSKGL